MRARRYTRSIDPIQPKGMSPPRLHSAAMGRLAIGRCKYTFLHVDCDRRPGERHGTPTQPTPNAAAIFASGRMSMRDVQWLVRSPTVSETIWRCWVRASCCFRRLSFIFWPSPPIPRGPLPLLRRSFHGTTSIRLSRLRWRLSEWPPRWGFIFREPAAICVGSWSLQL